MEIYATAIVLGFLGSFHCIGMCGPIAMALPVGGFSKWEKIVGVLLYNIGRVFTYFLLGLLFGALGETFVIGGFQQTISISLGIILLLIILLPKRYLNGFMSFSFIYKIVSVLKSNLRNLLNSNNYTSLFIIGLLNGLLPCGLVYVGIAGAIAVGSILKGGLFMAIFGAGTIPALFAVSVFTQNISLVFRKQITKAVPFFIGVMAVLLIVRGLNLGIPYLSPEISEKKAECSKCCHK
ncbi:MAG: sulfite exporter TauE/SafE family protein [Bacteroidetes bacterium]|nr:sulfite exporter TauE/SafE family protein [Bacteroidota bacterium]